MKTRECYFCKKKINEIDYRDNALLTRYLGFWGKIKSGHESRTCTKHQRAVDEAIKRARFLGFLPYTTR